MGQRYTNSTAFQTFSFSLLTRRITQCAVMPAFLSVMIIHGYMASAQVKHFFVLHKINTFEKMRVCNS
uniref:Uncharacterized protein n=1 Tax=Anguilla anguilla TaxID=7936 RepID=A0A0E9XCA3_ANGAN